MKTILRTILCPFVFSVLIVWVIWYAEGVSGIKYFLNVESFLIIGVGTFLTTWVAYPLRDIFFKPSPDMVEFAESTALMMGVLSTLIGLILLTINVGGTEGWMVDAASGKFTEYNKFVFDYETIFLRLALALNGILAGLFLAKAILAPIAWRMRHREQS